MVNNTFTARAVTAAIVAAVTCVTSAGTVATAAVPAADRTSGVEAARVDRVSVSLTWSDCSALTSGGTAQCATAQLPLDYDRPNGPRIPVAVLRVPAADRKNRIGSLFLNPGGPGGSGVEMAAQAASYLSQSVRDRFDIVGFDPRGTNSSADVRCWKDDATRQAELAGLDNPMPTTAAEVAAAVKSATAFGKACSTTGRPLSGSMSTAEVARDLDVLRRAVGDRTLNYLGVSYGSYLGNVYANLFPDRIRVMAIDGIVNPFDWAGTPATRDIPQWIRVRSATASTRALNELLTRCRTAGAPACGFAAKGDPATAYLTLKTLLRATPITLATSAGDVTVDYQAMTLVLQRFLYSPYADVLTDLVLTNGWDALRGDAATAAQAVTTLTALVELLISSQKAAEEFRVKASQVFGTGDAGYDNGREAQETVECTDSVNPADPASWDRWAKASARTAPDFGPRWTWLSAPCASTVWTVRDEDDYRGPYTRRTSAPILVVGNYWDPATIYQASAEVSRQLPNSRLLSNDSWGHTAYGTSACDTGATDTYLLTGALPAAGTVCTGDHQPFTPVAAGPQSRSRATTPGRVTVPITPAIPVTPVLPPLRQVAKSG